MKLSLSFAFTAFFCSCSFSTPVHAFLLTNLASRGLKHPTPPQQKGLYSRVEYDAREPVRLDEFGLPLDPSDFIEQPVVPLKDRIYEVVDKATALVEGIRGGGRRQEEDTRRSIHQRRATAKALAVKDKVLISLDYVTHPGKAWKAFVADPISARQQRRMAIQAEKRAKLERNLQRYYAAKNRFYETLDVIESTSRKTVKVAKVVGSAVVGAPATVKRTVKGVKTQVQETTDAVAKVAQSVSAVVSKISSVIKKEEPTTVGVAGGAGKGKGEKDEADPVKVREIWETKQQTAVRTIWEEDELAKKPAAPSAAALAPAAADAVAPVAAVMASTAVPTTDVTAAAPASAVAPSTPPTTSIPPTSTAMPITTATAPTGTRLSFRARLDAEEGRRAGGAGGAGAKSGMGKGLSFRQRLEAEESALRKGGPR